MSKIINLEEATKKKKTYKIFIYLIFILIIIYIIYTIYLLCKNSTDTYMVETGTVTLDESAIGCIIRDETVIKGENYKNGMYQIVPEGEKAAKNQTVFRYYGNNEEQIKKEIADTDEKLQKALANQNTIPKTDIKNIEKQIDNKLELLNRETDIQSVNEYYKNISELLNKKARMVGELSPTGSYIKELTDQREKLENELLKSSEYMVTPKSGIISYRIDDLENILTIESADKLTEESLEKMDIKTGKLISASNEGAKVIDNFNCYIITFLDSDQAKEVAENTNVTITLSSGEDLNAIIYKKYQQENGKMLIILKLDTLIDELISYRKISFNITWWTASGLKIKNSSIVEGENGLKYVIRKKTGNYSKMLVKVLRKNEKYSIVDTYKDSELEALKVDMSKYIKISIYDKLLTYPDLTKIKLTN